MPISSAQASAPRACATSGGHWRTVYVLHRSKRLAAQLGLLCPLYYAVVAQALMSPSVEQKSCRGVGGSGLLHSGSSAALPGPSQTALLFQKGHPSLTHLTAGLRTPALTGLGCAGSTPRRGCEQVKELVSYLWVCLGSKQPPGSVRALGLKSLAGGLGLRLKPKSGGAEHWTLARHVTQ